MTKIRANSASLGRYRINTDVFINGQKVLHCVDADEREGVAWVMRERNGLMLTAITAKPGDYVHNGAIIDRVTGKVEIRFTMIDSSEEEVRQEIQRHYQPIQIYQVVQ